MKFIRMLRVLLMSEWINVKSALPINATYVLVYMTCLFPMYRVAFFHTRQNRHFYSSEAINEDITKWVTHWMFLPVPPNKE